MKRTNEEYMNLINNNDMESINDFYSDLAKMYGGQLKNMFDNQLSDIINKSKYNGAFVRISQMNDTNWNNELSVFVVPNKYNWNNVYELKLIKENGKLVIKSTNKDLDKENSIKKIIEDTNSILVNAYDKYANIHARKVFIEDRRKMYCGQLKSMFDKELSNVINKSKYNGAVVRISQMNDTNWNNELSVFVVPNKYNWNNVYELKLIKENDKMVIKNTNKDLTDSNVMEILDKVYVTLENAYNKYAFIHSNNDLVISTKKVNKEKQYDVRETIIVKTSVNSKAIKNNNSKLNSYKPKMRVKEKNLLLN